MVFKVKSVAGYIHKFNTRYATFGFNPFHAWAWVQDCNCRNTYYIKSISFDNENTWMNLDTQDAVNQIKEYCKTLNSIDKLE